MKYPDDFVNKIINGDCLEVMKQMPDKCVDLVLTDIPYDGVNRRSNGLRNLDKKDADIITFNLVEFLYQVDRICKGSTYIFCGINQISTISLFFKNQGLSNRLLIWEKTNPSPMNGEYIWLSGIEPCVYAKNPKAIFNAKCKNTVLKFPTGTGKTDHPTEKPIELFKDLVLTSSNRNDIVLDPCSGSGTTAKACQELSRNFIGIEINPEYCKIAEDRLKQQVLNL